MRRTIKMKRVLFLSLGASLFLGSCAITHKKYTRPELELPEQYRSELTLTADTVSLPWPMFFKDERLVGLIHKALENNHDVEVALRTIDQLDLAMKQAKLSLLPSANLTIGGSRGWPSKNSMNGSMSEQFLGTKYMDDYSVNLGISWEADIWGKSKLYKADTRAQYFAQKENFEALKTRIIAQVAQAYYRLVALDEQLKIAEENVQLSEEVLRIMRLQYESGEINSLALEQSEAQKKTAELIIPLSHQSITVQENALQILCGEYPGQVNRTTGLSKVSPQELFSSGIPAHLLSRRPDLKAAEYRVISLNAKTGLAKTAMYPSITLSAQGGLNSFKFKNWFDMPGSIVKNLAGNITQPLFQKNELKTAYKTAIIEQEKAAIQFQQATMVAVAEVSDAMANYKGNTDRLRLTLEKGNSLERATKDAVLLYKSGKATYLEVITAQNAKLQNDLDLINLEQEKLNSMVELYRALGGGTEG